MSKTMIDNAIYNDAWFFALSPYAKLLFLFLITNPFCNLIGCYEMPKQVIVAYTKLKEDEIDIAFKEMTDRVLYKNSRIFIKNYEKHNPMRNPSIEISKIKQIDSLPEEIKKIYNTFGQGVNRVWTGYKETETETDKEMNRKGKEIKNKEKEIEKKKKELIKSMAINENISPKDIPF